MKTLKDVLIERDNLSEAAAEYIINEAKKAVKERIGEWDLAANICYEYFGLEPDYFFELIKE